MANGQRAGTVFLDRDGTVIVNKHYQKDAAVTELLPGARQGLERLRRAGFTLILVSNQSGIGRGFLTEDDLRAVNQRMLELLGPVAGEFAALYHCPHRPDEDCACRKPRPGMAGRAAAAGSVTEPCFVVGDSRADIKFGRTIGAATVLVRTGYGAAVEAAGEVAPDYVADGLPEAADWILRRAGGGVTPP
ncbi:MAG: HAD-IIIA family hydrolase [Planctomycetes bacterium]|nr:HAD-IIIA family hydrolase [Planctomycetota bacterium]